MLSMALPAHAGTVTASDPSGDALDPMLSQNDQTSFRTTAPSADITSYSLTGNTNGSLTASITVAGTIPAEGSTDPTAYQGPQASGVAATGQEYPAFVGGTYLIAYADTRTENNTYQVVCHDLTGAPKYLLHSHWQDGYRDYIAVEVTFDGTKWNYTPEYGFFDPTASGGFGFFELGAGEYTLTRTANTITLTANSQVKVEDATCAEGFRTIDFGRPGDTLNAITAFTTTDQVVVLPVTIPAGQTGVTDDISAVGGLVYTEDWSNQAGYALGTAGYYSALG